MSASLHRLKRFNRGRPLTALAASVASAVVLLAGSSGFSAAATGTFSLDRLRLGGPAGAEDYVFTTDNVVYPDGGVDPATYYRVVVTDSSGTVRNPSFPCTAAAAFTTTNNTYSVQPNDPLSSNAAWKFTLQQFTNSTCSGTPAKTKSKNFFVTKAAVYVDTSLTTQKTSLNASGVAYVVVSGLKPGKGDWNMSWITPAGTAACANTAGGDRPDTSSSGRLPGSGYLQYRPSTTATGSAWNREANYETRPCSSFSSSNEGQWKLQLQADPVDFVVVPVFFVDTTLPPPPTITSGPASPSNSSSASFSFSDGEAGVSFSCQLDAAAPSVCTSPQSYSGLTAGSHSFQVKAVDAAGNVSAAASQSWTVDLTAPPTPTITSGPASSTNSTSASFAFSDSEAGVSFSCQLDSGAFSPCTSPQAYSGLVEGSHSFQVKAFDTLGKVSTAASQSWTVDVTPPLVTLSFPSDGSSTASSTPPFGGNAGIAGGDSPTVTVKLYGGSAVSGSPLQTLSAQRQLDSSYLVVPSSALSAGTYIAQAEQADAAGNAGYSAPNTFTVTPATCSPRTSAYSSTVLATAGLVGYWRLGESSGTLACDSAGTNNGSYQSGTTLAQPGALVNDPDTAVGFNGTSGWVQVPANSSLNVGDRFSIEAWVKRGTVGGNDNQVIASKQSGAWVLMFDVNNRLVLRQSGVGSVATSTAQVSDTTTWHHVVATKDGATVHLYLDGFDVTGPVANQTMVDNSQPLAIGQSSGGAFFNGTIDELALYNVVLTPAQVANHYSVGVTPPSSDPVIAAAGDIACDPAVPEFDDGAGTSTQCRQQYTSNLLLSQNLAAVLALGDNQYGCGGYDAYLQSYGPSWGRVKSITYPVPGNHEYTADGGTDCDPTGNAAGYFRYFGGAAGDPTKGYYSFDIGSWHLIALNSNCAQVGGCPAGSPEETWLRADLAMHPSLCTLAFWHHPRFTSASVGNDTEVAPFWQDLYAAGAELILNGHAHGYERFALQDSTGAADPSHGIREFVVGTGGEDFQSFSTLQPLSEVQQDTTFGVLTLTLHATTYDWRFVPEAGRSFTDSGSGTCR